MKNRSLSILTVVFSICLLVFACRKEITYFVHDRTEAPSRLLESAKVWYLQHLDTKAPKIKKYGLLPVYWKDSWKARTADSNTILVVPAEDYYIANKDFTFKRFLTFKVSDHSIADGRIVELVGRKYNVEDNFDFLTKNYNQSTIPGFNGDILQYDVSYRPIKNTVYENGKKNKFKSTSFAILMNKQVKGIQRMYGDCGYVWPNYHG